MKNHSVLACLLGLLGTTATHASELKDVFGREVPLGQGRPALVLYANRETRQVLSEHAPRIAYALREERPIVVVHVDLRGVPGLFKGKARSEIRKSHQASLREAQAMFREQGLEPPDELDASLFMVADSDGTPHREQGLDKGFEHALARAVSASGRELARGPFPEAAGSLGSAIEVAAGAPLASVTGSR